MATYMISLHTHNQLFMDERWYNFSTISIKNSQDCQLFLSFYTYITVGKQISIGFSE